jgi:hypothetical protein
LTQGKVLTLTQHTQTKKNGKVEMIVLSKVSLLRLLTLAADSVIILSKQEKVVFTIGLAKVDLPPTGPAPPVLPFSLKHYISELQSAGVFCTLNVLVTNFSMILNKKKGGGGVSPRNGTKEGDIDDNDDDDGNNDMQVVECDDDDDDDPLDSLPMMTQLISLLSTIFDSQELVDNAASSYDHFSMDRNGSDEGNAIIAVFLPASSL